MNPEADKMIAAAVRESKRRSGEFAASGSSHAWSDSVSPFDVSEVVADGTRGVLLPIDLGPVLDGDFEPPAATVFRRDDLQALFNPGQLNGIHGDSGTGKGWIALSACAQQLQAGRNVAYIDAEDVPGSIVGRLRILGVADDTIRERFDYYRPLDALSPANVETLRARFTERSTSLVVIDSLGEMFGLAGVDENYDAEVGPWLRQIARPLADAGPAVLLIDHSTKANDNPLHPSGSKRKRAAIGGASYLVTARKPLSAETGGRLQLKCAKDRHGSFRRDEIVADWVMTVEPGIAPRWALHTPDESDTTSAEAQTERAVEAAVAAVEHCDTRPITRNSLESLMEIKASNGRKRAGIDQAVARGLLVERDGPRNARMYDLPAPIDVAPEGQIARPRPTSSGDPVQD